MKERFPDYSFIGMETTEQSRLYTEVEYPRSGCIVILGNEVTGIDPELMTELDSIVEIPMFGAVSSSVVLQYTPSDSP